MPLYQHGCAFSRLKSAHSLPTFFDSLTFRYFAVYLFYTVMNACERKMHSEAFFVCRSTLVPPLLRIPISHDGGEEVTRVMGSRGSNPEIEIKHLSS
jgi:hypothetical protein